jgi:transposase InsO family protein
MNPFQVKKMKLNTLPLNPPKIIGGVFQDSATAVTHVAHIKLDVHGQKDNAFALILPDQHEPLLLGRPFLQNNAAIINEENGTLEFQKTKVKIKDQQFNVQQTTATEFHQLVLQHGRAVENVFVITLEDIDKALTPKPHLTIEEIKQRLPPRYHDFIDVFNQEEADKLPPHRPGIDHEIPIEKDQNGNERPLPWGALYGMSREQLLVLRKTLSELLQKGYIRESKSDAAAPVLFVKKPGGGLRFCVDYRGLNAITKKDRYPLPLLRETFMAIAKAKHLSKMDVIAAFHKIRVKKEDIPKTAFRTRYGLFEWLVTPFGLTGAPATFQRYINFVLREYLDDFVSAYIDDILVFSSGTQKDHEEKVCRVLSKCREAGLYLDIRKCEFNVKSVKYLGFIVNTEKGLQMDPEKVKAVHEWEPPKTLSGLRGFLGFVNFYRDFIPKISEITYPLHRLTKKGVPYTWENEQQQAFDDLKRIFTSEPVLAAFEIDRPTQVEPDSSKWSCGAVLTQQGPSGQWHPCAYFSEKNSPAECNYDIHDKELLAIVKSLKHWRSELLSLEHPFTIITDHQNLRKFQTKQRLSERQVRWSSILEEFRFTLLHRPGTQSVVPDALSRREQDIPAGENDPRLLENNAILLPDHLFQTNVVRLQSTITHEVQNPFQHNPLKDLWQEAYRNDTQFQRIYQHVKQDDSKFPADLGLTTVSMSDCQIINSQLYFRERVWLPSYEPLTTCVIQTIHDSSTSGHPGRDATIALIARQFFWPNLTTDTRRFIRNCDVCGRTTIWREKRRGLLKPLPVPDRVWQEISVDFITDLPLSHGATMLCVITDRLSKGTILFEVLTSQQGAEGFANLFLKHYVKTHWLPRAIVSDRGSQFVNAFWTRVCKILKIDRRLSSAYHPETDGSTERRNQEIEAFLRCFVTYSQDNWVDLLPIAQISLDNRLNSATGLTPFFLTHGYNVELIDLVPPPTANPKSPLQKADDLVAKLKDAQEWAQVSMVISQQQQQDYANQRRAPAEAFKVGDDVWLNLKNVRTLRPCKKLDWIHAKYKITKVVNSMTYELNTPPKIHNRFHTSLLRRASTNPLPSQKSDDHRPPPIIMDNGNEEFAVDEILKVQKKYLFGKKQSCALVKWTGYAEPTWEPLANVMDTEALERFQYKTQGRPNVTG